MSVDSLILARPVRITEAQILDAARDIFLRDGVHACTAEIARRAGVSEGSVFKRFPTKDALLAAALRTPPIPPWVEALDAMVGVGDPQSNLARIVLGMLDFTRNTLPLVMVAWGSKPCAPPLTDDGEHPAVRDRRRLTEFLAREMALGRLRECDADAAARMILGAAFGFVMDHLMAGQSPTVEQTEAFAERLTDVLWKGIERNPC